jgi:arsenate reductase (glutaredoxin)
LSETVGYQSANSRFIREAFMSSKNLGICRIIGTKKDNETKKIIRYCRERSIPYQFADLLQYPLTAGELQNICSGRDPQDMIDTQGKFYKEKGYAYLDYDPLEEMLENPELIKVPIVRKAGKVFIRPDKETLDMLFISDRQ